MLVSFDRLALKSARNQGFKGIMGLNWSADQAFASSLETLKKEGIQVLCPYHRLITGSRQVRLWQAKGFRVLPWGARTRVAMKTLIAWGVDGLTVDDPERLQSVLLA